MDKQIDQDAIAEFLKSEQGEALITECFSDYLDRNDPAKFASCAQQAADSAMQITGYLNQVAASHELTKLRHASPELKIPEGRQRWLDSLTIFDRIRAALLIAVQGARCAGAMSEHAVMCPERPTSDIGAIEMETARLLGDVCIALLKAQPPQVIQQISKARVERLTQSG
ncbi:hypothetical protein ACJJIG_04500 [Microbulbifer sp. SSSA007]|uniref:hypothetical protein n=1 Tax=Microbulbifer sp. SSSA007 TaxID=3243379 RepID=UPI00403A1B54